jgi:peroxiredoxin
MLIPRNITPALVVETLSGTPYDLSLEKPSRFSLVCFYRGLHCPVCSNYLRELDRLTPDLGERGVTAVAISSDTEGRARKMSQKIGAVTLRIGYGLELAEARKWGLYISASRGSRQTATKRSPRADASHVEEGHDQAACSIPSCATESLRSFSLRVQQ